MNIGFWKNKKVFLTGHTGFKGAWLALWLKEMGAVVTGYALAPPTHPSLFSILRLDGGLDHHHLGDIRDYEKLRNALVESQADIVFHLAAQPLVRRSYREPLETFAVNVMGTAHVLDAIRFCPSVKSAVIVTTDKCYENREWFWPYREEDAMGGYDPYSSSKGCSELVTSAYRRSFFGEKGCAIASARAGNVIGGGDFAEDRIIPDIYRAFSSGKTLEIRNPSSVRPWQHVLEPLSGYLELAEKLFNEGQNFAEGWNFGPNTEDSITVREVVNHFTKTWKATPQPEIQFGVPSGMHEAKNLQLDISKARQKLKWEPALTVEQGIQWTVEWYSTFAGRPSGQVEVITKKQIQQYQAIVGTRA